MINILIFVIILLMIINIIFMFNTPVIATVVGVIVAAVLTYIIKTY